MFDLLTRYIQMLLYGFFSGFAMLLHGFLDNGTLSISRQVGQIDKKFNVKSWH